MLTSNRVGEGGKLPRTIDPTQIGQHEAVQAAGDKT